MYIEEKNIPKAQTMRVASSGPTARRLLTPPVVHCYRVVVVVCGCCSWSAVIVEPKNMFS